MNEQTQAEPGTAASAAVVARPPVLAGPKRQHYLPRFYLEGFTKDGFVAVYDRVSNEVRLQKPENTGVIGHFYTMEDDEGRKRFELEQMLSDVEGKASPVIKKLAAKADITADERAELALFLALAMARTPDLIDSIKATNADMVKRFTKVSFANVKRVMDSMRGKPDAPTSEEELEKEAKELVEFVKSDQYEITTNHRWAVGMGMRIAFSIAPILAGRNWLVQHRDSENKSFVTTDAPLILTTVEPRKNTFWGIGFANADALVMFPLTDSCALLIFGSNGNFVHSTIGTEKIRIFNLMLADRCQRFVVGREEASLRSLAQHLGLGRKKWRPKMSAH
jgi:hypothetical protein